MAMEERIEGTERKQRNTMAFLARALKNPIFIQQLMRKRRSKKKRSAALQTAEELEIASEIETMLGTEKERGSGSIVENSGAVFDAYREVSEMSDVIWELMNEGLEVTGAGGGAETEGNIKAESFEEDSGHWNDEVQGFVQDFA